MNIGVIIGVIIAVAGVGLMLDDKEKSKGGERKKVKRKKSEDKKTEEKKDEPTSA